MHFSLSLPLSLFPSLSLSLPISPLPSSFPLSLFVEKLPKHPEYSKALPADKVKIKKLLKVAFPRAMELKEKLKLQYEKEKEELERKVSWCCWFRESVCHLMVTERERERERERDRDRGGTDKKTITLLCYCLDIFRKMGGNNHP